MARGSLSQQNKAVVILLDADYHVFIIITYNEGLCIVLTSGVFFELCHFAFSAP